MLSSSETHTTWTRFTTSSISHIILYKSFLSTFSLSIVISCDYFTWVESISINCMYFYIGYVRMATYGRRYGRETIHIQMLREERKAKPKDPKRMHSIGSLSKRDKSNGIQWQNRLQHHRSSQCFNNIFFSLILLFSFFLNSCFLFYSSEMCGFPSS